MRRPIEQFLEIPIPDHQRKRTDVCCTVLSILLPTFLLCAAITNLNKQHLFRANFPSDSNGGVCGLDFPTKPYLLFPNPNDRNHRICVSHCPYNKGNVHCTPFSIQCKKSSEKIMLQQGRVGKICAVQDPRVRDIVLYDSQRNTRRTFFNVWDSILLSTILSIAFGFLYLILVQCLPHIMNWISVIFGGVASIILGILIFKTSYKLQHTNSTALYVLSIFFVVAGIAVIISAFLRQVQMRVNAVFLIQATTMIRHFWVSLLYIPLFLLAVAGLVTLTLFQLFAFWSKLPPVFDPNSLYWLLQSDNNLIIYTTLVGVQLIWGLNFIAQAYNFIIAGNGVDYYFGSFDLFKPLGRLVFYHWGSVAGGSFIIGFFGFFDAFFDFFKPTSQNNWHANCCSNYFGGIYDFFDIVRHDAMGYINLTGLPYCNAARFCDFLSVNTPLFGGSQSISRIFRFSGHLLLTSIVTIIGIFYAGFTTLYSVLFTIIISYFIVEMFASLHANAAEGICTTYLAQQYLQQGDVLSVKRAPLGLVQSLRLAISM